MEGVNNAQIIAIPDDVCQRAGAAASWVGPNKLGIYAYKHVNFNSKDAPSTVAPCTTKVHFLRPEIILFSPILRKMVNESNGIFVLMQELKSTRSGDVRPDLLKYSKDYRCILRACIQSLQNTAKKCQELRATHENYLTVFYNVECVWHLTEILYVKIVPGDVVLPPLLEWIRFHFPSREMMAMKIIDEKTTGAELNNVNYWEAVYGCALHGQLEAVRSLLSLHSRAQHRAFIAAENIVRAMPIYSVYGGYSVSEFTMRWKHWQIDLSSALDSKTFAVDPNLEILMKLFAGQELWEFACYSDTWYELLAGKLLYSVPCCKLPELAQHANNVAIKWGASRNLDNVILALMESDLHQVVKEIQYMNDNGWFAAHLTDLLFHCGRLKVIDTNRINVTGQLHESLILDYGSTLMGHRSLWQCGASYLKHCPRQGLARLEVLLQTIPLGTETRVNKIIDLARENDLHNVVMSICKIQGMKSIQQGRLGNALTWALKAPDGAFATYMANRFLEHYLQHGVILCKDLLENMGSCMLTSERLTFLGKYCEFHQIYRIGEFKEAASLLIALIVSNITPKYFWPTLFTDAISLLEGNDAYFTSNDCHQLLYFIEEYGSDPKFQDKILAFRLAVTRNLARVVNFEDCQER